MAASTASKRAPPVVASRGNSPEWRSPDDRGLRFVGALRCVSPAGAPPPPSALSRECFESTWLLGLRGPRPRVKLAAVGHAPLTPPADGVGISAASAAVAACTAARAATTSDSAAAVSCGRVARSSRRWMIRARPSSIKTEKAPPSGPSAISTAAEATVAGAKPPPEPSGAVSSTTRTCGSDAEATRRRRGSDQTDLWWSGREQGQGRGRGRGQGQGQGPGARGQGPGPGARTRG